MKGFLLMLLLVSTALVGCHGAGVSGDKKEASGNASAGQPSPTHERKKNMKGSHVHFGVRDLPAALHWLETVWQLKPTFHNDRMAALSFGELSLILDASLNDAPATVGFESENCDEDFQAVVARGGVPLEEPRDRPWGVRSAYIQGPGALKFEIEQMLPRRQ